MGALFSSPKSAPVVPMPPPLGAPTVGIPGAPAASAIQSRRGRLSLLSAGGAVSAGTGVDGDGAPGGVGPGSGAGSDDGGGASSTAGGGNSSAPGTY